MRDKHTSPAKMSDETKSIEHAMRRAVRQALLTHKRAGNTVAAWRDGRVVLVKSDNIRVEGLATDT
ncbi:MAG: hypothetical protein QOE47_316 [Pyrinomonadaceae bacterium]|jgi:hypothetical protein|nr:hypothetical protein [Pyrinomonadaceae bacterium]MDX6271106.1 hypothetical protein [Acidobacteriota bacterium]